MELGNGLSMHHEYQLSCYETLSTFLLSIGFTRGKIDKTLFIKWKGRDFMMVQIYVDDIIFESTCNKMCDEFRKLMTTQFEMSVMRKLVTPRQGRNTGCNTKGFQAQDLSKHQKYPYDRIPKVLSHTTT